MYPHFFGCVVGGNFTLRRPFFHLFIRWYIVDRVATGLSSGTYGILAVLHAPTCIHLSAYHAEVVESTHKHLALHLCLEMCVRACVRCVPALRVCECVRCVYAGVLAYV